MKQIRISLISLFCVILCSCALLGLLFDPSIEEEKADRFFTATHHQLLRIFTKEEKLGYIYDNGIFVKKVWGGTKIKPQATGQTIKLTYTKKDFDSLKLILGEELSLGPGLENVHHVVLQLEDIYKYELIDFQPLIEYMGENDLDLLGKEFVVSMLKVSKFSVRGYQKVMGEFGAEYRPYPFVKIKGSTGMSSERGEEQIGYNLFVGCKVYSGKKWVENFNAMPKLDVWITKPTNNITIKRVRARVEGSILQYNTIADEYKNKLRLYIMTRDEYKDNWILQSKARIDTGGNFEGIVKLGSLEKGNGHRYSIATFVTYFKINRKVNSTIPFLPFNKGKYIVNVKRDDDF